MHLTCSATLEALLTENSQRTAISMPTPTTILLIHENPIVAEEIQGALIGRGFSVELVITE